MTPEIQRDGTKFSERSWTEGQWCRFYRDMPKKMGGYKEITKDLLEIPRGIMVMPKFPNFRVFVGTASKVQYFDMDSSGNQLAALVDITPVGFDADANNIWDFDVMYSSEENVNILVANASPNAAGIDSNVETPIYFTYLLDTVARLTQASTFVASGGILAMHPYLFFFGNDGEITWTAENDPTTFLATVRPTSNKIVCGLSCRAGNSSPAGLFWSLDCLVRVTHTGTTNLDFTFDSVTCESSVLSSQGIIEYDGSYYWAAIDRFLMYNGTVQELPNDTNLLEFFNKINMDYREKVWVTKNTKWGEIWWHYPSGTATECNRAIIYNVRTKKWLDTDISRSDGEFDQTFAFPVWAANQVNSLGQYSLWMHEIGVDSVALDGTHSAIRSYIRSGDISWCAFDPNMQRQGVDKWTSIYRFEPDMIQTGNVSLTIGGTKYARSAVDERNTYIITAAADKIDLNEQRRQMYLEFESNVIGGNFEMGQHLMVMRVGDGRQ